MIKVKKLYLSIVSVLLVISLNIAFFVPDIFAKSSLNSNIYSSEVSIDGVLYDSIDNYYQSQGYTYVDYNTLLNLMQDKSNYLNEKKYYTDRDIDNYTLQLVVPISRDEVIDSFDDYIYYYTFEQLSVGGYTAVGLMKSLYSAYNYDEYKVDKTIERAGIIAASFSGSEYDKIKSAFEYLCNNISYDYSYSNYTAYDAFFSGKCVCDGYAQAFQLLMEAMNIPCKIITGVINYREPHAWNAVCLDGRWYQVDTTWGDAMYTTGTAFIDYRNLLMGTDRRECSYALKYVALESISYDLVNEVSYEVVEDVNIDYSSGTAVVDNNSTQISDTTETYAAEEISTADNSSDSTENDVQENLKENETDEIVESTATDIEQNKTESAVNKSDTANAKTDTSQVQKADDYSVDNSKGLSATVIVIIILFIAALSIGGMVVVKRIIKKDK